MGQMPLPEKFLDMAGDEAANVVRECKARLGKKVVILGHHYQRDEIIEFADFTGDSLRLSEIAAEQSAKYIVFCGVHFMAESADILASEDQMVFLPDMDAGCSMADMAEIDDVEVCWEFLEKNLKNFKDIVPVTYVNSSANIKAFVGRNGGYCCTSSNCEQVLKKIWDKNKNAKILFLPDQHLGRNTAFKMGVPLNMMAFWKAGKEGGGGKLAQLQKSPVILWNGSCCVHQKFNVEQIKAVRKAAKDMKIIVHPECCFDVVQAADYNGSTSQIIKIVEESEPGSQWAIGTESSLVNRLRDQLEPKGIYVQTLGGVPRQCSTMYRNDIQHLAWIMDLIYRLDAGEKVEMYNRVVVDDEIKADAKLALRRMLEKS
ncbi:MAG: quinolinate synthase NadA [Phycisphaerae bacterium]|nr:quinolinate synthase NadA [Phycisphaerae bacterium]